MAAAADRKTLRRAIAASAIGNATEWFDYGIYAYAAVYIGRAFFPSDNPAASTLSSLLVFAVSFLIRPLGGLVWGPLGDRLDTTPGGSGTTSPGTASCFSVRQRSELHQTDAPLGHTRDRPDTAVASPEWVRADPSDSLSDLSATNATVPGVRLRMSRVTPTDDLLVEFQNSTTIKIANLGGAVTQHGAMAEEPKKRATSW